MRTYRVGDSMPALVGWNLMVAASVAVLVVAALDTRDREEEQILFGIASILVLAGPVAFIAYLARYFLVRVELGREGVIVSSRHQIPWSAIRSVRRHGVRLGGWNPFAKVEMGGCGWFFVILAFKFVLMILALVLVVWILRVVVLPVLVLYSPWHSRVVIETEDGMRLVYRDLEHAELFVEEVRDRIRAR